MATIGQKAGIIAVNVVLIISAIILLILSFSQVQERTHTKAGSYIGSNRDDTTACTSKDSALSTYRPMILQFESDPEALFCPWRVRNSAVRIIAQFVCLVVVTLNIVFVIVKKKQLAMWILLLVMALLFVLQFYVIVQDGTDLIKSQKWCNDNKDRLTNDNPQNPNKVPVSCPFKKYQTTGGVDILFLFWIPNVVLTFLYQKKWNK
eukprot:TRINITY_DN733_c0_g1_i1.p1 TRINITY_DN733_c0_g1~~TRINITY_DN733_c0_g1_i1.p1  ORF type:complete len:219 (+),score=34.76 TRINITY_DN733_c0_g1_i1:42-659(+)